MVAAATTTVFMLSAQDGSVETQGIGVIIDAHALVDVVNDEIVFDFSNDDPGDLRSTSLLEQLTLKRRAATHSFNIT